MIASTSGGDGSVFVISLWHREETNLDIRTASLETGGQIIFSPIL